MQEIEYRIQNIEYIAHNTSIRPMHMHHIIRRTSSLHLYYTQYLSLLYTLREGAMAVQISEELLESIHIALHEEPVSVEDLDSDEDPDETDNKQREHERECARLASIGQLPRIRRTRTPTPRMLN